MSWRRRHEHRCATPSIHNDTCVITVPLGHNLPLVLLVECGRKWGCSAGFQRSYVSAECKGKERAGRGILVVSTPSPLGHGPRLHGALFPRVQELLSMDICAPLFSCQRRGVKKKCFACRVDRNPCLVRPLTLLSLPPSFSQSGDPKASASHNLTFPQFTNHELTVSVFAVRKGFTPTWPRILLFWYKYTLLSSLTPTVRMRPSSTLLNHPRRVHARDSIQFDPTKNRETIHKCISAAGGAFTARTAKLDLFPLSRTCFA